MCSISGVWRFRGQAITPTQLRNFNNVTAYRGPDGEGIFVDANANLGLGHRRLSILDLSEAGKQPMYSADGNLVITYNGEIFNYLELKAELSAKGHSFRSGTDTEVILAAYLEWGEDCLHRFNGMWAFAIWNIKERSLFVSRDRFGIKPLYYVYEPGKLFAFASESIAFSELPGFERRFSDTHVDLAIRNSFYLESAGRTIYAGIRKLFPGHFLKLQIGKELQMTKWWKIEEHLPSQLPATYEEQVEHFRDLFTDACRLRLRSDVPVGVALSGGLDSSAVYSTIQQLFQQCTVPNKHSALSWQNAFIACFPDTKMDEQVYADQVVQHTQGKANHIFPAEADIATAIYESTRAEDYIYMSPPVVHSIYREMRAKNIKVSLDGHGADEVLFGYPHMVNELMEQNAPDTRKRMLLNVWADMTGMSPQEAALTLEADAVPAAAPINNGFRQYIPERFKRIARNLLRHTRSNGSWLLHYPQYVTEGLAEYPKLADPGANICLKELQYRLPTLLRNWDRASMRHGVEIRMPFLDYRLVTFLLKLPDTAKVAAGYTKKTVRDAMTGWMPDSVRLRKAKIGINAPMEEWFNGPLSSFLLDAVNSRSFLNSTIWNGHAIRAFVEKQTRDKQWTQKDAGHFWPYLNAWILMREN